MFIGAQAQGRPEGQVDPRQEARTRDRVLRSIVERGPLTAAQLAADLGLTAAAVRRHLDALVESEQIRGQAPPEAKRGRGRPARAYVATEAAHRRLASEYDDVATAALHYLAAHAGPAAVRAFAAERVAGLEARYAQVVDSAGPDVLERARALAQALAADGFAATARPLLPLTPAGAGASGGSGGAGGAEAEAASTALAGVQLCQGHCPMQQVAVEFPQFCEAETDAFARLLGVHVQRLATLAGGGHACTTFVPAGTRHVPDDERTAR